MISRRSGHLLLVNSIQGRLAVPFRSTCEFLNSLFHETSDNFSLHNVRITKTGFSLWWTHLLYVEVICGNNRNVSSVCILFLISYKANSRFLTRINSSNYSFLWYLVTAELIIILVAKCKKWWCVIFSIFLPIVFLNIAHKHKKISKLLKIIYIWKILFYWKKFKLVWRKFILNN